jgi:hypothetical protein
MKTTLLLLLLLPAALSAQMQILVHHGGADQPLWPSAGEDRALRAMGQGLLASADHVLARPLSESDAAAIRRQAPSVSVLLPAPTRVLFPRQRQVVEVRRLFAALLRPDATHLYVAVSSAERGPYDLFVTVPVTPLLRSQLMDALGRLDD